MQTRQEIYDRIRESSKDEVILDEMVRLGFWPETEQGPESVADEIRREAELTQELRQLASQDDRLGDPEQVRREARRRRLEESRRKQKENKERRLQERAERTAAWQRHKQTEIVFLGQTVSNSLNQHQNDLDQLKRTGVPIFAGVSELARQMDVSVGELRFLAYDRKVAPLTHYQRFAIPKKTGGVREISAPMPRLKWAQHWILANILDRVELHDAAHGFRRGRSIISNARPHIGQDVVINLDLEDFFPTVTFPRIRGVFRSLGYSGQLATLLALLCSEPVRDEVELDRRSYHVARTPRLLPQGAPTSPALTNIICRGLDVRLAGIAERNGFTYTRYADDITFSGSGDALTRIGRVLRQTRFVVADEDFVVHPKKTRILRKGSRQEVTGLTVNEQLGVSRELLRRFRALLFHIQRDGPAGKHWGGCSDVMVSIEGFANFVTMVDPEKGRKFQVQVERLQQQHGTGQRRYAERSRWEHVGPADSSPAPVPPTAPGLGAAGQVKPEAPKKKKPWWKFW